MTAAPTTTNPRETGREEAIMATFTVLCPCCGSAVSASDAGFSATTVEIAACPTGQAAGIVSRTMRKSAAYAAAAPVTVLAHRDGLVSFGS